MVGARTWICIRRMARPLSLYRVKARRFAMSCTAASTLGLNPAVELRSLFRCMQPADRTGHTIKERAVLFWCAPKYCGDELRPRHRNPRCEHAEQAVIDHITQREEEVRS